MSSSRGKTAIDFDTVYDRMGSESSKWHSYPPDVLPMYVADMDFRSPEPVIRALRERVEHGFFGYGREQPEFFEVVTARLAKRYGWVVEPEAIVVLPGVITSFNVAVKALTKPGDGVLIQVPGYGPIRNCPERHGAERREADLVQGESGRYEVDWDSFERASGEGTKLFLLCNPHNPVGRVFSRDELSRMAETCLRNDMLIVSDEIHSDLVYDGHPHTPIATLSPEVEARVITLMAPSKTFNLPGLKCSIAIIPNKELREQFVAAKGELVRAVNILGYTASLAAYRDGDEWLEALLAYLQANRDYLADYVRDWLPGISCYPAEGTYLAWLDCRGLRLPEAGEADGPSAAGDHGGHAAFFLNRARVALSNGPNFGTGGSGFVRLNFACPRPSLEEGLSRIRRAIEAL